MDCKSSIKNDVIKFCDLTRKGFFCLHDLQIFLFKNVPVLIISYMKNRYLHLMLSGSFAAEESLTLKINWLDPDFLVEDGMVVSDVSPHGILTIPPFPSKTQVFVIVKIEITKLTLFDNFHLSIVSLTMVIWYFWKDIVCVWLLYTLH